VTDALYQPGTAFAAAVDAVRADGSTIMEVVDELARELTDAELLGLLDGDTTILRGALAMVAAKRYMASPVEAGRVDRLGIPGIRFTDGPRGVALGASTSFPVAIARAASWNTDLEARIGDAIGKEARAQGANFLAGICVNLAPAPGWGRTQESYGEDPVLLGAMGAALHCGAAPWVMTCVKHFALNSMEDNRFRVDVEVDDATLHEVYLPHFRTVIEAGVDAVMTSYNSVNGLWAGQSGQLLSDILRDQWQFAGFVLTDFVFGLRDPVASVTAGQDLEMPYRQQRAAALPQALADGELGGYDVKEAARRLLSTQIRLAIRAQPTPPLEVVTCPDHLALAREAASMGSVLLRNKSIDGKPILPLGTNGAAQIAVLGPLADMPNLGDVGSSQVHSPPKKVVTIVEGLSRMLGNQAVHTAPAGDVAGTVKAARAASAALVVVGLTSVDEGESMNSVDADCIRLLGGIASCRPVAVVLAKVLRGIARLQKMGGDRRDLGLHPDDVALIQAVAAVNSRTIVIVIGGGTIVVDPWDTDVAAILMAWYPGMEGGTAIADMLFGNTEPGGRLPFTIPHCQTDLPTANWTATTATYGRWWGQRYLDRTETQAAYPFGYGLGYTTFKLADLRVARLDSERIGATLTVTNTGDRRGRHVVQIYGTPVGSDPSPPRSLLGFKSLSLDARETATITVDATTRPLQHWTGNDFVLNASHISVEAASYSGDPEALTASLSSN
jgi:beta-glucosidase